MGKSRLLRLSAFLMLLWYLACTAGFNLHTCLHSGETSVVAFAGVQTCTPAHVSCGCCSHCSTQEAGSAEESIGTECCEDDFRTVYANAVLPERQSCPDVWHLWNCICDAAVPGHASVPGILPCAPVPVSMEGAQGYEHADKCLLYCIFRI